MIEMPKREVRPATETSVLRSCIVALNRLPGVRVARNNNGKSPCACKGCTPKLCASCRPRLTRPITFGLGDGSPDIQGRILIGRVPCVFWIEVKSPTGRTSRERRELQAAFRAEAESRGELCAQVTDESEAVRVVERMRVQYEREVFAYAHERGMIG